MLETLVILLAVGILLWGVRWTDGDSGLVAALVESLRSWHTRYSAAISLPM